MIIIEVHGTDLVDHLRDYWRRWWPDAPLSMAAEAIVEDAKNRLENDTESPDGEPWEAWSEAYAATRGPGDKLLYSSGDLADSLTADRSGSVYDVGSDIDYALVHQFGSRDGTTKARPYVGISADLERSLDDLYSADFERGWSGGRA